MPTNDSVARATFQCISVSGEKYIFDVSTAAVFKMDDSAIKILRFVTDPLRSQLWEEINKYGAESYRSYQLVKGLLGSGFFRPDTTSDDTPKLSQSNLPWEVALALTYQCTLGCRYCYANKNNVSRCSSKQVMSNEMIDAAFDWAVNSFAPDGKTLNIWTGTVGETLLRSSAFGYLNKKVEKYNLDNPRAKDFSAVIHTTNLTLLDYPEADEFLSQKKYKWRISIDGPKYIHDAMRVFPDGRGSYDVVSQAIPRFFRKSPDQKHTAAATLTGANPYVTDIFLHLYELGFREIVIRPVRATPNEPYAINAASIGAVKLGYSEFTDFLLSQDDSVLLDYLLAICHEADYLVLHKLRFADTG